MNLVVPISTLYLNSEMEEEKAGMGGITLIILEFKEVMDAGGSPNAIVDVAEKPLGDGTSAPKMRLSTRGHPRWHLSLIHMVSSLAIVGGTRIGRVLRSMGQMQEIRIGSVCHVSLLA